MLQVRTTFWIFILLLLVSAATWIEKKRIDSGMHRALPSRLVAVDITRADRLTIETAGRTLACVQTNGVWKIVDPSHGRADPSKIRFLLETLARMPARDRISARQRRNRNLTLEDYGLVPPRTVVTLRTPDGYATLRIGGETPGGDGLFVMGKSVDTIYVADRLLLDLLPQSVESLRDPALVPDVDRITRIDIRERGKPGIQLEKIGALWLMREPHAIEASPPAVNALLTAIANATIDTFVPPPPPDPNTTATEKGDGAARPPTARETVLTATLGFADGPDTALAFLAPGPDRPDTFSVTSSLDAGTLTVDRMLVDALKMDADVLRERRVFPLPPSEVLAVSFSGADCAFTLRLDDTLTDWILSRPSPQPTDQQAATAFLSTLLAIKDETLELLDDSHATRPVSEPGTVKIEITPMPPTPMITAYATPIRDAEGTLTHVSIVNPRRQRRQLVPASQLPEAFLQPAWFATTRDTRVLAIPGHHLASLTRRAAGDEETAIIDASGGWFSAKPLPVTANQTVLTALAACFANLQAAGVAALYSENTARYGLNPPAVEYIITTRNHETPVTILLISAPGEDGTVHVKVKGRDAIFIIDPTTAGVFAEPLTRLAPPPTP